MSAVVRPVLFDVEKIEEHPWNLHMQDCMLKSPIMGKVGKEGCLVRLVLEADR